MTSRRPAALSLAVSALASGAAYRLARGLGAPCPRRWERTNHADLPVTLLEGPAYAVGAACGAALAGGAGPVVVLGSAGFGLLDDLSGDSSRKGLRGHLSALRRGTVTTGAMKLAGLTATGLVGAELAHPPSRDDVCARTRIAGLLVDAGVMAGAANVINLFDLRPGRALKVTALASGFLLLAHAGPGATTAAAALGAAAGVLAPDLRGEAMLGDTGANAAGALVGLALVERLTPRGRIAALAVITTLTLTSERISFTRVIESTPVLRELDALGRSRR